MSTLSPVGAVAVRILGAVEFEVAGRPVVIRSGRQRELLVLLALSVGQAVPVEQIAWRIWGDRVSPTPSAAVHTIASRLRKVVGADVLLTRADGYVLALPEECVDLHHFRTLVREAHSGVPSDRELELLTEALALWRAELFAGLEADWLHRSVAPLLLEEWFAVLERRLDLLLVAGRHRDAVTELQALVRTYPLRETLWARLMVALHRSGRQADAFTAYQAIATALREEFGADPGAELSRAYQMVLHGPDATAGPLPARTCTLPRDLEAFTARDRELAELISAGEAAGHRSTVVCVLEGMAGAGKTALAVHAAHVLADRFPDGQLYVDLHAYTPGRAPLTAGEAVGQLLGAVGVDRVRVPADEEQAAALWRTSVADRRVLVVLDNVVDSAQVRLLLPSGAACMAIVASRRQLAGLDGARVIAVSPLNDADAARMFVRVTGRPALAADDPGVVEVVGLCGRLPLALTLAAARLRHRTAWDAADLAVRLRDQRRRMAELRAEDRSVASVFELSVDQLPDHQRELLLLVGMFIRTTADRNTAAVLAGISIEAAETSLEQLADAHLVEEATTGRYQLHDLVRVYLREEAGHRLSEERRAAAVRRLLSYFVNGVDAVDRLLRPYYDSSRPPLPATPLRLEMVGQTEAVAWCVREHGNLVAAVELATAYGEHTFTWHLACLLWEYLDRGGYRTDMVRTQRLGLDAARLDGNHMAETQTLNALGLVYQDMGEFARSLEYLELCLARARECGLESMTLSALNSIGSTHYAAGDYAAAIECFRPIAENAPELAKRAGGLSNMGEAYRMAGDLTAALDYGLRALRMCEQADDAHGAAKKRVALAETYRLLSDPDSVIAHAEAALPVLRGSGDRVTTAEALTVLGSALRQRGALEQARRAWREALEILQEMGSPDADEVRRHLAE